MSLDPLYTAVSWVLLRWHQAFTVLGLPAQSGLNWILSIALLVLSVRLLLLPLTIRQLRHQRALQAMQPQFQAIRARHPKDRAAQQREIAAVQQGTNPLLGCLPMLLQLPIFLSLLQVLRHLANSAGAAEVIRTGQPLSPAAAGRLTLYGFSQQQTISAARAKLLGAPLAGSLRSSGHYVETVLDASLSATRLAIVLVVALSASAAYLTQRLLRAGSPVQDEGNVAIVARLMPVLIPVSVVLSGLFFPLGLLFYWGASNVWTCAQQWYLNRFHPHPEIVTQQPLRHPSPPGSGGSRPGRRYRASERTG